jgi:hypothetical protein
MKWKTSAVFQKFLRWEELNDLFLNFYICLSVAPIQFLVEVAGARRFQIHSAALSDYAGTGSC